MPSKDPSFPLIQPSRQPLFDLAGFDQAIASKGILVEHWRALPCPGGLDSPNDVRRPHEDHLGCSSGFLFSLAGTCNVLFTGNSTSQRGADPGLIASSSASITLDRHYADGSQVRVSQYDRLFLPDNRVLVETWERFQHSPNGRDKLRFPVVEVVGNIVSSSGKHFAVGDFAIVDGCVEWRGFRPATRPNGRGEVCAVRYIYRPYWYVQYMSHDLRMVTQDQLLPSGESERVVSVYQAASVAREFFFETEERDREAPNPESPRQRRPPEEPIQFGPR